MQDASLGLDISIVTKDSLQDKAHNFVMAASFPVIAECPMIDQIILAEWTTNDYGILLDLIYGQKDRLINVYLYQIFFCFNCKSI